MKHSLTIYDAPVFYIQGLSQFLLQKKIFENVFQYNSHQELIDQYKISPTDFVIHGSYLNTVNEIVENVEALFSINPRVKFAIVGNLFELSDIRKLFEKGIHCYLDRDTNFDEFLEAIKIVKSDNIYVCNSAKERMIGYISHQNRQNTPNVDPLTKREIEVMKLICEGFSSKIISEKLFISINTVETHRKKILMKLNVKNSIGIVKYAVENNMLE